MSNTKHTPGLWTLDEKLEGQTCITSKQHGSFAEPIICRVFDSSHVPLHEQDANARLIAAAPELLRVAELAATLNTQTNHIGSGMLAELVERARAAIAKATNG